MEIAALVESMSESSEGAEGRQPTAHLVVREKNRKVSWDVKFFFRGRQVWRRVGPAWVQPDGEGGWRKRRGRPPEGVLDQQRAWQHACDLVDKYVTDAEASEQEREAREARGITFRELAAAYLDWLENVRGAKPSTLAQHRIDLAEPGRQHKRGGGKTPGWIIGAIGDLPAASITTSDVDAILNKVAAVKVMHDGHKQPVTPRTVNRYRSLMSAIFNFGMRESRKTAEYERDPAHQEQAGAIRGVASNPVAVTDKRHQPELRQLVYYTPEEVEAAARALEQGKHRIARVDSKTQKPVPRSDGEMAEDMRDGEAVRVSAYGGLRQGELLALRWRDIDWAGVKVNVSRAVSAGIETTPKSGKGREIPMSDQLVGALNRLSQRHDYVASDDLVFCDALGGHLDASALRRRYVTARDSAGLRPLRWHDLRHTFGSLLVAGGIDLVTVKSAMGHSRIETTERYLHARPATEDATRFTAAFGGSVAPTDTAAAHPGQPVTGGKEEGKK